MDLLGHGKRSISAAPTVKCIVQIMESLDFGPSHERHGLLTSFLDVARLWIGSMQLLLFLFEKNDDVARVSFKLVH